ncbi:hypothetical protein ALP09_200144 [Pseudomonas amygdali pv. lachrymans]|nr:hypothetical protein ALP09_200144 [Pseudomonas amygdali pv. lachrymans]
MGSSASGVCHATPSTWWCRTPNTILKNSSASRSAWRFSAMTVLPRNVMAWSRACAIWAMTAACMTGNWSSRPGSACSNTDSTAASGRTRICRQFWKPFSRCTSRPRAITAWTCVVNTHRCPMLLSSTRATPTSCSAGASRRVFSGTSNTRRTSIASSLPIPSIPSPRWHRRAFAFTPKTPPKNRTALPSGAAARSCSAASCIGAVSITWPTASPAKP